MLKVIKPGFFTSLQDVGRFGYRDKGVPVSGVMDTYAISIINTLLENTENASVIEMTMIGPVLEFKEKTYICLAGADISATLNEKPIRNNNVYEVDAGAILSCGKLTKGVRAYLGVKNGFSVPKVLGSVSYYIPITAKACFKKEDSIPYEACDFFKIKSQKKYSSSYLEEVLLEVYKGPEYDMLTDKQLETLFFKDFSIAKENNRMAYQLNEKIEGHKVSMLTSATLPGTVQFTPSGKLIILMKDGQTTGGYPRILQLTDRSIAILAQKKFGEKVSFRLV